MINVIKMRFKQIKRPGKRRFYLAPHAPSKVQISYIVWKYAILRRENILWIVLDISLRNLLLIIWVAAGSVPTPKHRRHSANKAPESAEYSKEKFKRCTNVSNPVKQGRKWSLCSNKRNIQHFPEAIGREFESRRVSKSSAANAALLFIVELQRKKGSDFCYKKF